MAPDEHIKIWHTASDSDAPVLDTGWKPVCSNPQAILSLMTKSGLPAGMP